MSKKNNELYENFISKKKKKFKTFKAYTKTKI